MQVCMPDPEPLFKKYIDNSVPLVLFVQYRDNLWLLGGTIIKDVSSYEEHETDALEKIHDSVIGDGILPDDCHLREEDELKSFARMCRKFEKYLALN